MNHQLMIMTIMILTYIRIKKYIYSLEANEKINGYQIVIFNSNVYVEYFSNPCDLFQDSIDLVADNYKNINSSCC